MQQALKSRAWSWLGHCRGILQVCDQCVVFSRWDEGCVGVYDKTVKLWDVTSGECLQTLEGHSDL